MLRPLLLSLLLSIGCADPFADAQQADTIDAYEAYLRDNPAAQTSKRTQAERRLEELMLEKGRQSRSLADYDAYLQRFPKGSMFEDASEERRDLAWVLAEESGDPAAWEKYIEDYKDGDKKQRDEARRRLKMAKNKDSISLSPLSIEQVNLAEDPNGPLNGWGFFTEVTNTGDKPIQGLYIELRLQDGDGKTVGKHVYPLVDEALPGRGWAPDEWKAPLQPGQKRTWEYTTGDLPTTWGKKATVTPVSIRFVGEQSASE